MFTPAVFYDLSGKYFQFFHLLHNDRITLTIFNSLSGKYINFLTSSTMTASALLSSLSSMMAETTFLSSFVKTLMFGDWNQRCGWCLESLNICFFEIHFNMLTPPCSSGILPTDRRGLLTLHAQLSCGCQTCIL